MMNDFILHVQVPSLFLHAPVLLLDTQGPIRATLNKDAAPQVPQAKGHLVLRQPPRSLSCSFSCRSLTGPFRSILPPSGSSSNAAAAGAHCEGPCSSAPGRLQEPAWATRSGTGLAMPVACSPRSTNSGPRAHEGVGRTTRVHSSPRQKNEKLFK